MTTVQGTCDSRFEAVRELFQKHLDDGADVGASFAATLDGEFVVDLGGGYADEARTRPWQRDTIVNVYSTTKTVTALCALILADRGLIDFYAPVAKYWPEFAQNGKAGIEVRHLMSHSAGVAGWDVPLTVQDQYDWEKVTSLLAAQAPWWEPGTASGYHAATQGFLIGEVMRRVTGKSVGTFLREEVAGPLGADFHIGLAPEHDARVGEMIPPPADPGALPIDPRSLAARAIFNPPVDARDSATDGWRRAQHPAGNGHGNARSVARLHAVLACGGEAFGARLLSREGCDAVFDEQTNGVDMVLGVPLRFGIGFALNSPEFPVGPNPRTCWWSGWGGSIVLIDYDARATVSYVMNSMREGLLLDARAARLARAFYHALVDTWGAPEREEQK